MRIGYAPQSADPLDIEIFSWRSLAARVPPHALGRAHRIEFHELLCVTRGHCVHGIDFQPFRCSPGSVLATRPGQTEQFDVASDWDGWLVLFRPEFVFDALDRASARSKIDLSVVTALAGLPPHLALLPPQSRVVTDALRRMHLDAEDPAPAAESHALLRHQLCALVLRLARMQRLIEGPRPTPAPAEVDRFHRFNQQLELSLSSSHRVSDYAARLGCTEKTLTRAALAATGLTAKAVIAARIALEAKRLLVHTTLAVGVVADRLGFDDASNFVKFFRREAGCGPLEFRHRHDVRKQPEPVRHPP